MVVKPGASGAPASPPRVLTTSPIPEVWAAVVVMPLYAYNKKNRHRSITA
jgi:hypothetical protein